MNGLGQLPGFVSGCAVANFQFTFRGGETLHLIFFVEKEFERLPHARAPISVVSDYTLALVRAFCVKTLKRVQKKLQGSFKVNPSDPPKMW